MKYFTVETAGGESVAVSENGRELYILDGYADMNALIRSGDRPGIPAGGKAVLIAEDAAGGLCGTGPDGAAVRVISPVPEPLQDVLCLGINYRSHETEASRFSEEAFGGEKPKAIFFSKRVNRSPGPGDVIPSYPGLVETLDYETELGVVIGKDAFRVKAENAADYIFGYTIVNDVSARNLQTAHRQWYFGKSLDGFTPMGPCIMTADETAFPPALRIRCSVNGVPRQDSTTDLLIHGIAEIIETLSAGMTLRAGTIIATGTPAGVGMGLQPPVFLKTGDVVRMEIEGIGVLQNTVR